MFDLSAINSLRKRAGRLTDAKIVTAIAISYKHYLTSNYLYVKVLSVVLSIFIIIIIRKKCQPADI
jgi:hypothetical protein